MKSMYRLWCTIWNAIWNNVWIVKTSIHCQQQQDIISSHFLQHMQTTMFCTQPHPWCPMPNQIRLTIIAVYAGSLLTFFKAVVEHIGLRIVECEIPSWRYHLPGMNCIHVIIARMQNDFHVWISRKMINLSKKRILWMSLSEIVNLHK
jgi:hypothetical protein